MASDFQIGKNVNWANFSSFIVRSSVNDLLFLSNKIDDVTMVSVSDFII